MVFLAWWAADGAIAPCKPLLSTMGLHTYMYMYSVIITYLVLYNVILLLCCFTVSVKVYLQTTKLRSVKN